MKKMIFAAMMLLVATSVNAENWFNFSESVNDTLRIRPNRLGGYATYTVDMAIDAYCDFFRVGFVWPCGLRPKMMYQQRGIEAGYGLSVCYLDRNGMFGTYTPNLNVGEYYESVSSSIAIDGYYDYNNDSQFEPYGTVKWEPGIHYSVMKINLWIEDCFRKGHVVFDAQFNSGSDKRGPILSNVYSWKQVLVYVGYMKGDVNGDERHTIADVTFLIDYLLNGFGDDEFAYEASDLDGNGNVTINDVAVLINRLLNK